MRSRLERSTDMKTVIQGCLVGTILIIATGAQKPVFRQGIAVEMPVANHAIEMRAADEGNTVIVAITANGRVFVGIQPTEPTALTSLSEGTVYVKADSRVPYQEVLAVLDALRGKSVVLLSAPPETARTGGYVPAYGTKLTVSR